MSYVGAAANLVGGVIQSVAATKAQKEMFKEFKREQDRQSKFQQRATKNFNPALQQMGVETARQQMAAGQTNREEMYNNLVVPNVVGVANPDPQTAAYLQGLGHNRAVLGSYGDWQLEQAINNIRTNEILNKISNFAGGSAQVFPYRMYQAQHSGDELAFWGKLISSIGGSGGSWMDTSSPQGQYFGPGQGGGGTGGGYNWGYTSPSGSTYLNVPNMNEYF